MKVVRQITLPRTFYESTPFHIPKFVLFFFSFWKFPLLFILSGINCGFNFHIFIYKWSYTPFHIFNDSGYPLSSFVKILLKSFDYISSRISIFCIDLVAFHIDTILYDLYILDVNSLWVLCVSNIFINLEDWIYHYL